MEKIGVLLRSKACKLQKLLFTNTKQNKQKTPDTQDWKIQPENYVQYIHTICENEMIIVGGGRKHTNGC